MGHMMKSVRLYAAHDLRVREELIPVPTADEILLRKSFVASLARRKGLTIQMVRRMKHVYPRAIELVSRRLVNVQALITHRYKLKDAPVHLQWPAAERASR